MLSEKNAIITGTSRGIGMATVEVFARNGANVFACARKPSEEFENRLGSLSEKYGVKVKPVYFDVTDEAAVKNAVKEIGSDCPALDILVNNAGVSIERLMGMTSLAFVRETMDVNYLAQVQLAQLVSRYMMKQKAGSIVNVASVAGVSPEKGGLAYGSSKAAVIFSTCTMALELADFGIRVNAVSPGFIDTDMWGKRNEDLKEKIRAQTPLHRHGTPQEVANTIMFLASDMSSYITGQNIIVDGGRKLGEDIGSSLADVFLQAYMKQR